MALVLLLLIGPFNFPRFPRFSSVIEKSQTRFISFIPYEKCGSRIRVGIDDLRMLTNFHYLNDIFECCLLTIQTLSIDVLTFWIYFGLIRSIASSFGRQSLFSTVLCYYSSKLCSSILLLQKHPRIELFFAVHCSNSVKQTWPRSRISRMIISFVFFRLSFIVVYNLQNCYGQTSGTKIMSTKITADAWFMIDFVWALIFFRAVDSLDVFNLLTASELGIGNERMVERFVAFPCRQRDNTVISLENLPIIDTCSECDHAFSCHGNELNSLSDWTESKIRRHFDAFWWEHIGP